jgi:hypothetical protein
VDFKGITWEHMAGEASIHGLKGVRVTLEVLLVDCSGSDTEGAQTMQDWSLETTFGRLDWVNVKRVVVAVESVQEGLSFFDLQTHDSVSWGLRGVWKVVFEESFPAESTNSSDKAILVYQGFQLSSVFIFDFRAQSQDSGFALILQVMDKLIDNQGGVILDGRDDLNSLFAVEQHHWVELGNAFQTSDDLLKTSVSNHHWHGGEGSEVLSILVSEVVVRRVLGVLLETESE